MVVIGSRGSQLALTQSEQIKQQLLELFPQAAFEVKIIKTQGDKTTNVPLAQVGGKGFFTKELETALLEKKIDLVVHSLKDLPVEDAPGLTIGAIPQRIEPRDVLLSSKADLNEGDKIGTSSLRRQAQIKSWPTKFDVRDLRGNLDTRLKKLARGHYQAIVVAQAGLNRLAKQLEFAELLPPEKMLPAPGQGALAIQIRQNDQATARLVAALHDQPSAIRVTAERSLLHALGGGCQVPVGALAELTDDSLTLRGLVISLDGLQQISGKVKINLVSEDKIKAAQELGQALAKELLAKGAKEILWSLRK